MTQRRKKKMKKVLSQRQFDIFVVLENIHDPFNVSAILRTCEGFGIQYIYLLYTIEKFPEINKKVSASAYKWITLEKFQDIHSCFQKLKNNQCRIYATSIDEKAKSYLEIDWSQPSAIVFGNEHRGCSQEILNQADELIFIPMKGMVQSFNVSVSVGIILSEIIRQREITKKSSSVWDDKKEKIFKQWLAREKESKY